MFLRVILESFQNLFDALDTRKNQLDEYYHHICNNQALSEEAKNLAFILTQVALFSDEGITKKELCEQMDISSSTIEKRLDCLREKEMLLIDKSGRSFKYSINLNIFA